jgi:DNA-binding transcriptional ArsR family regulator
MLACGSIRRLEILKLIAESTEALSILKVAKTLKFDYGALHRHTRALEAARLITTERYGRERILKVRNPKMLDYLIEVAEILYNET